VTCRYTDGAIPTHKLNLVLDTEKSDDVIAMKGKITLAEFQYHKFSQMSESVNYWTCCIRSLGEYSEGENVECPLNAVSGQKKFSIVLGIAELDNYHRLM
jgi:hypothetical protein